jgi:phosphomevalonate kinase
LTKKDLARFVEKCELEHFGANNQYIQLLRSQNELDHHLSNTSYVRK